MTIQEAAERWGLGISAITRYCRLGMIAATKVGGQWNIPDGTPRPVIVPGRPRIKTPPLVVVDRVPSGDELATDGYWLRARDGNMDLYMFRGGILSNVWTGGVKSGADVGAVWRALNADGSPRGASR